MRERGRSERRSFSADLEGDLEGDFVGDCCKKNGFVGEVGSFVGEVARRGLTRSRQAWRRASRF